MSTRAERKLDRGKRTTLLAAVPPVYRALGPARFLVWVLGALALIGGLIDAISLYLVARLATALGDPQGIVSISVGSLVDVQLTINETLMWSAIAVALLMALSVPIAAVSARLSAIALTNCRTELLDAYLSSSWAYRNDQQEGHLQHLVAEFTPRIERFVLQLAAIIVNSSGILMSIVAAVIAAPAASVYFVVGLGAIAAFYVPLNKAMSRLSGEYLRSNRDLSSEVAQTARLSQEIESFHVGASLSRRLHRDIEASSEVLRRFRLRMVVIPASYQNAALAVVLAVIALLKANGSSQLAVMGPVLLLLVRALIYARQLQYAVQMAIEMTPYVAGLQDELDEMAAHPASDGTGRVDGLHDVRLVDVSFAHIAGMPVLDHLSVDLPFGTVLGVSGPSGVGKSTLLQLLLRLRHPTQGRIEVNGADLRDVSAAAWAGVVAFVPQDNKLLHGTIAENIAFLRPFAAEQIQAAAAQAHLLDEVLALPGGFDTMVGPGARDLSGGQKQRLGIARALIGAPQLVVLDEPTSALDARSEGLIGETIGALRGSATFVIVTHRADTLAVCDRVLELRRPDAAPEAPGSTERLDVPVSPG